MLHIIILNKNYFPQKLNTAVKPGDKVVVIATPDGSIPVSAYQNESLKNMEVKLLPEIKDTASPDGRNVLRIAQAMYIGQLTATVKEFEIYTDDNALLKALAPFTGKKSSSKRKSSAKPSEAKAEKTPEVKAEETKKKTERKSTKTAKADVKKKPVKLPTQAEVKRVLGAANSSYTKLIMEVIKKSNQITFEMDLRMKLVEAGMEASQCQELARTINEEFGKSLPASM